MSAIDLSLAADVYWSRGASKRGLQFRRFASLEEAVRFLMEDKSEVRSACTIETDETQLSRGEIANLYASMTRRIDDPGKV